MHGLGEGSARRRNTRDWLVDTALFLLASANGLLFAVLRVRTSVPVEPSWLFQLDQVTGVLGCAALWLRRRWPVELALVLMALAMFSELVGGAMLVALFTVAVHRSLRTTVVVFGLSLLSALAYVAVRPEPGTPGLLLFLIGLVAQGTAVGWGLFVHRHRQLLARAKAEAALHVEQAQLRAREEVAREMHDVLGHRLSLLSVYAGALEYNPGATPGEVTGAATVIRQCAHQALQDLREIIGVLRLPVGELPQPTFAEVRELVAESRDAGMAVELTERVTGAVPDQTGRAAYRVVQEALTNARKHAPGAAVRVVLTGAPGAGLTVETCNDRAAAPALGVGGGQGLAGLAERVALAHGTLEHGPRADGGWRLAAWLPWPS